MGSAKSKRAAVVIVGFGRMGGALALGLRRARWPVSVLPRSAASVRRAAELRVPLADLDALRAAKLCVLAVPDAAVPIAAAMVEADLSPTALLVHCSGALPLTAFGQPTLASSRAVGSFHPLAAISDPTDTLRDRSVAVASTTLTGLSLLTQVAGALRLKPIQVPETGRAAYHAGAVMSAGLLVALADAAASALAHAGLSREEGLHALLPLMRSALDGIEQRGLSAGLTGPVVRGDVAVVQAHLDALPAELGSIYRLLSKRALDLAERLPAETRLALARIVA